MLAALRRAEQTGEGDRVEVALAEACGSLFTNQAMNYLIGGSEPRALGNTHPNVAPYQVIRAGDRDLAIAATSDVQFARLARSSACPSWSATRASPPTPTASPTATRSSARSKPGCRAGPPPSG